MSPGKEWPWAQHAAALLASLGHVVGSWIPSGLACAASGGGLSRDHISERSEFESSTARTWATHLEVQLMKDALAVASGWS